jgi:hypothetical protein
VLTPDPPAAALFFAAAGRGRHIFAVTYREHLDNIRKVRGGSGDAQTEPSDPVAADSTADPGD